MSGPSEPGSVGRSRGPALTDMAYDAVRIGPVGETLDVAVPAELAARLSGLVGERREVAVAPPAVYPALLLEAVRTALGGIPAGAILAREELELHAALPVPAEVTIATSVFSKEVRRGRPLVTFEFDVRDSAGAPVATGRKTMIWPTGPATGEDASR